MGDEESNLRETLGTLSGEIAETLEISANTVHYHLRNIYERLGIGSRAELARLMAEESG
ncbi:MAG: helix-turn-helix transcriptional regulator [Bradymonadaceae bacterium]